VATFGRCRTTGCSERAVRECHSGLLRIRLLLKNTKARRLGNWKADVRRARRVRRQLVCMLSRMVRVRDRIIKSSLKRAERSLRDCKRVSCRRRGLRRLNAVRRRMAFMLQVARDAVVSSKGAKGACVRTLQKELARERKVVARVVKVTARIVKAEKKVIAKAREKLLSCSGSRCVSQQRRIVRREKRVLRVAKKQVRKAKKVVRKLVVTEISRINKLKQKVAACSSSKCERGIRRVIRLERSVVKAVKSSAKSAATTVKKVAKTVVPAAVVRVEKRVKQLVSSLKHTKTAKKVVRVQTRIIREVKKLESAMRQCKNGKCVAKLRKDTSKLVRQASHATQKALSKVKCTGRKCRATLSKVKAAARKVYSKENMIVTRIAVSMVKKGVVTVSTDVESRCEALRISISTHSLDRNLCGKDSFCRHRHSARIHTAMADLAALKDCMGPAATKAAATTTAPATTVTTTGSVARDACDDEIAEWNTDREEVNRKIAAAYTEASECKTAVCTQLALASIKSLHDSAVKLRRPQCAVAFFRDLTKGPAASTTTTTTTTTRATGTSAPAKAGASAAPTTPALPSNIRVLSSRNGKPGRGQIFVYDTPFTMTTKK